MISTFLKTHLVRLKPKRITYKVDFIADVENNNFSCENDDPNINYENTPFGPSLTNMPLLNKRF